MEFRAWASIPCLPPSNEQAWEPIIEYLEREHAELGPVASWDDPTTFSVVISFDAEGQAAAGELTVDVVTEALHAAGQGDHYVSAVNIEPADAESAVLA